MFKINYWVNTVGAYEQLSSDICQNVSAETECVEKCARQIESTSCVEYLFSVYLECCVFCFSNAAYMVLSILYCPVRFSRHYWPKSLVVQILAFYWLLDRDTYKLLTAAQSTKELINHNRDFKFSFLNLKPHLHCSIYWSIRLNFSSMLCKKSRNLKSMLITIKTLSRSDLKTLELMLNRD